MPMIALPPLIWASAINRFIASLRLSARFFVMPCNSPPNIDLKPAPIWENALRDRTVRPNTSPHTRWISQPGRSLVVTISTGSLSDAGSAGYQKRAVPVTVPPVSMVGLFGRGRAVRAGGSGLGQIRFLGLGRLGGAGEREHRVLALALAVPVIDVDRDELAGADLLEQDLLGQRVLDLPLDRPPQRPCAQHGIKPALGQQRLGTVRQLQRHVLALELLLDPARHQG